MILVPLPQPARDLLEFAPVEMEEKARHWFGKGAEVRVTMSTPTIYLIAGCNGAGKTTFAREFLPNEVKCLRFFNADEIARGLSPLDPGAGAVQAGRLLLRQIEESLRRGRRSHSKPR